MKLRKTFGWMGLVAMVCAVVMGLCACSDDDDDWNGTVKYTVTSSASTSTTALIAIKSQVLDLYEQAVQDAITAKGYTPVFSSSVISTYVGEDGDKTVCDNYVESYCLQLEDEVEETTFVGNIVVKNVTTGKIVYNYTFR